MIFFDRIFSKISLGVFKALASFFGDKITVNQLGKLENFHGNQINQEDAKCWKIKIYDIFFPQTKFIFEIYSNRRKYHQILKILDQIAITEKSSSF